MQIPSLFKQWSRFSVYKSLRPFSSSTFRQDDPELIILNPVQAGLVKMKPRKPQRQKPLKSASSAYLDYFTEKGESEPIVYGIHSQRPETANITSQRYDQLSRELLKGFKKPQLEEYLTTQKESPAIVRKMTKKKMVEHIMSNIWKVSVKDNQGVSGESPLIENVIDLSEEEFVLVLGNNGRLLREWSKSGAKISILPARFQIIVQSSPETFEWINASLGLFLETLVRKEIDLTNMSDGLHSYLDRVAFQSDLLAAMQRLSNTFFHTNPDGLIVYSAGRASSKNVGLVQRLLLQISQRFVDRHWCPSQWWFDTNSENISSYRFRPFNDTDSLEWIDRAQPWWRWETIKTRNSGSRVLQNPELRPLQQPEFSGQPISLPKESLHEQVEQVVGSLVNSAEVQPSLNGESVSTTLSVTPGFILHNQASLSGVPHAGSQKTFTSNIPHVANMASSLPMHAKDIQHEDELEKESFAPNDDSWASILDLDGEVDSEGRKVFVSRHKDLNFSQNLKLVQMKFVVDPEVPNAEMYPPIEAWAELPPVHAEDNTRIQEVPRIVAVPLESQAYISLPNSKTDLKVSCTHTYPIAITEAVENYFLKSCRFGRVGVLDVKPEIDIEFAGQTVTYKYLSASYVTLAELNFHGGMMQFLQSEGGKLGGRRVEASLISHTSTELSEDEVQQATSQALKLASDL